jgi:hypothetical protein
MQNVPREKHQLASLERRVIAIISLQGSEKRLHTQLWEKNILLNENFLFRFEK